MAHLRGFCDRYRYRRSDTRPPHTEKYDSNRDKHYIDKPAKRHCKTDIHQREYDDCRQPYNREHHGGQRSSVSHLFDVNNDNKSRDLQDYVYSENSQYTPSVSYDNRSFHDNEFDSRYKAPCDIDNKVHGNEQFKNTKSDGGFQVNQKTDLQDYVNSGNSQYTSNVSCDNRGFHDSKFDSIYTKAPWNIANKVHVKEELRHTGRDGCDEINKQTDDIKDYVYSGNSQYTSNVSCDNHGFYDNKFDSRYKAPCDIDNKSQGNEDFRKATSDGCFQVNKESENKVDVYPQPSQYIANASCYNQGFGDSECESSDESSSNDSEEDQKTRISDKKRKRSVRNVTRSKSDFEWNYWTTEDIKRIFNGLVIFVFYSKKSKRFTSERIVMESYLRSGIQGILQFEHRPYLNGDRLCLLMWEGKIVSKGIASKKKPAKRAAAHNMIQKLTEICYTLQARTKYFSIEESKRRIINGGEEPGVYRIVKKEDAPSTEAIFQYIDDYFKRGNTDSELVFAGSQGFSVSDFDDIKVHAIKRNLEFMRKTKMYISVFKKINPQYWMDKLLASGKYVDKRFILQHPHVPRNPPRYRRNYRKKKRSFKSKKKNSNKPQEI